MTPERTRFPLTALSHAVRGLAFAWRTQPSLRLLATIAAGCLLLAAVLHLDALRWALLTIVIALVLSAELVNTSIEAAVDGLSPGLHPAAGAAKDISAAAVLVICCGAAITGVWIFGPALWALRP